MLKGLRRTVRGRLARRGSAAHDRVREESHDGPPQGTAPAAPAAPDIAALLDVARQSFLQMQLAWDAADLPTLAGCTTEPLLAELTQQLQARGPGPNRTEVLSLQAKLFALDELREAYVASVEFSGFIREDQRAAQAPFRELWLLAMPKAGALGWRLAGVQSLS